MVAPANVCSTGSRAQPDANSTRHASAPPTHGTCSIQIRSVLTRADVTCAPDSPARGASLPRDRCLATAQYELLDLARGRFRQFADECEFCRHFEMREQATRKF